MPASGDPMMITGEGLGILSALLKADSHGLAAYSEMITSKEFISPIPWTEIDVENFDGIVLAGGHAKGMKEYLESSVLQKIVCAFFSAKKVVGAICHGTVLAARSKDASGKSVLHGRKTTALLRSQELAAWILTCLWLKSYYRTYSETVQYEVTRSLAHPSDFVSGPLPILRDSLDNIHHGFVLEDQNYISARWPGDAHRFGMTLVRQLRQT